MIKRLFFDEARFSLSRVGRYKIQQKLGIKSDSLTLEVEDVVEALKSGKLGGYATDVWSSDPPENTPLLEAPNTILTPHIGASTRENMERIGDIVERLLERHATTRQA